MQQNLGTYETECGQYINDGARYGACMREVGRRLDNVINKAKYDYGWKGDLKDEGTQRLSMWETAHWGDIFITPNSFNQYRTLTEDALTREKNFRAAGYLYKSLLQQYGDIYDEAYTASEIDIVDKNDQISTSDQSAEIYNFQQIEAKYLNQEQLGEIGISSGVGLVGLTILIWALNKLSKKSTG